MNLYKLATGISTNIKDTKNEKNKSKKSSKNILNNIGSKKQKLKIVENKIYDKNKKNEVINKNVNYDNDIDNEEEKKNKEEREKIAYQSGEHYGKRDVVDSIYDIKIKDLKNKLKNTTDKSWITKYNNLIKELEKERDDVINNNKNIQIKDKSRNKSRNKSQIKDDLNFKYPDL